MTEQEAITKLEQLGYTDVHIVRFEAGHQLGQHTHDLMTGHIILTGEMFVTDEDGTDVIEKGDLFEVPAGTTHSVSVGTEPCAMAMGTK